MGISLAVVDKKLFKIYRGVFGCRLPTFLSNATENHHGTEIKNNSYYRYLSLSKADENLSDSFLNVTLVVQKCSYKADCT